MSIKELFPQSAKNFYHLLQAVAANVRYGWPSRKIIVIGVTGTNGKTTTCQMIAKILADSHGAKKVALASTINFQLGEKQWVNKTKLTTLSAFAVQKFIAQAVGEKCRYLVLETSSHSLDQYRVWGVKYDTAVITNLTREHLDYHRTMEEYRSAKERLFRQVKNAVVNLDMEKPETFLESGAGKIYGYTTKNQNVNIKNKNGNAKIKIIQAEKIEAGIDGSSYQVLNTKYQLHLPGLFNVENALAATCVGLAQGVDPKTISAALAKIENVPGRMDEVKNERGLKILIDYAVTPDSLEKLGQLVSGLKKPENRLIWVFGSCGERDRGKRPLMGEIVAKYADYVFVTNEDPYGEDPIRIINQVFSGVIGRQVKNFQFSIFNFQTISKDKILDSKKEEGRNCWRILDRREAIADALKIAQAGDIVLVTGKGAEETMAVGKKKRIPWNDRKVIEEELKKSKK